MRIRGEVWDLIFWVALEYLIAGIAWALGERLAHFVAEWIQEKRATVQDEKPRPRRRRPSKPRKKQPREDETTPPQ